MTGILVSGYDVDTEHVADVFESMATDIRNGKIHITHVGDGVDAEPDDVVEYDFEMSFHVDGAALTMDYLNGRLVDTEFGDD